jgi:glycosyltransferase involved in cell wall biosynthesis
MNGTQQAEKKELHPIRLAVAIPTMNRPDHLRCALRSVAAQIRKPDEVFIFDNSAKADAGVVAEFPALPIRYENLPERVGVEEAFHRAISGANGTHVALLEDDNLWLEDHLVEAERMIRLLPDAGLYGTQAEYVLGNPLQRSGKRFTSDWPEQEISSQSLFIEKEIAGAMHFFYTPVCASAVTINREIYDRLPMMLPGFGFIQDRWMWAQLAVRGGMVLDRRVTVLFHIHAGQLSHHLSRGKRIHEHGQVARCLYELMVKSGLDPVRGAAAFGRGISRRTRARWTVELLRSRQRDIIAKLLPAFRCTSAKSLIWPGALLDAFSFYSTRLLGLENGEQMTPAKDGS